MEAREEEEEEKRGMEWRLKGKEGDRNRGQEGGRLVCRKYLDVGKRDGDGKGSARRQEARERERPSGTAGESGMLLGERWREAKIDGNKLRS